jgi:hypothetical protein
MATMEYFSAQKDPSAGASRLRKAGDNKEPVGHYGGLQRIRAIMTCKSFFILLIHACRPPHAHSLHSFSISASANEQCVGAVCNNDCAHLWCTNAIKSTFCTASLPSHQSWRPCITSEKATFNTTAVPYKYAHTPTRLLLQPRYGLSAFACPASFRFASISPAGKK